MSRNWTSPNIKQKRGKRSWWPFLNHQSSEIITFNNLVDTVGSLLHCHIIRPFSILSFIVIMAIVSVMMSSSTPNEALIGIELDFFPLSCHNEETLLLDRDSSNDDNEVMTSWFIVNAMKCLFGLSKYRVDTSRSYLSPVDEYREENRFAINKAIHHDLLFVCNHDTCCWCQTRENISRKFGEWELSWGEMKAIVASRQSVYTHHSGRPAARKKSRENIFIYSIDHWTFPPNNNSSGKSSSGQKDDEKCVCVQSRG